jgi:hypothetical protein
MTGAFKMEEIEKDKQRFRNIPPAIGAVDSDAQQLREKHLDRLLDEALDASFPASDPSSIGRAS